MIFGAEQVTVRETRLPGVGHRYEILVDDDHRLVIVLERNGRCALMVRDKGAEQPHAVVPLSREQAITVAMILSGARFSIDTTDDLRTEANEVTVETVALSASSPAVGKRLGDVELPSGADTAVLAVIRDDTPELLEDDAGHLCQPGDRVVLATRADAVDRVATFLAG